MLVHRTPSINFSGTHLHIWVERSTVREECLAQENNTMSPARARARTGGFGDERTNHKAKAPSTRVFFNTVENCFHFFQTKLFVLRQRVQFFVHLLKPNLIFLAVF